MSNSSLVALKANGRAYRIHASACVGENWDDEHDYKMKRFVQLILCDMKVFVRAICFANRIDVSSNIKRMYFQKITLIEMIIVDQIKLITEVPLSLFHSSRCNV